MSHYKAYPAYKDSGVEWLGPVPEHWEVSSLKYLVSAIDSGTSVNATDTPAREGEFGVLKTSCVYSGTFDPAENKAIVLEEYGRVSCPLVVGSLIVSRMNTPDLVGAAGLVRHAPDGIFLPDRLWQVSFSGMMPTFSYYWSQSDSYRTQVKKVCTGTSSSMQNLSQDQFKDFVLGVPAEGEQQLITAHLDRETARIDALIEKKTRFIQLLREKRQALITHAVTKGLNPNVKVKDSGVEWLGEMPEHWELKQLKHLVRFKSGGTPSKDNIAFWDGDTPWASAKDLKQEMLADTINHLTQLAVESGAASLVPSGSILVVVRGMILARLFPVVETQVPMAINQDLKALIPSEDLNSRYLAHLLRGSSAESLSRLEEAGHGTKALRMENWVSMEMPVPPLHEQLAIVAMLDTQAARIDSLATKSEHSIALLKERRSALITAAVTGQIDLREAV